MIRHITTLLLAALVPAMASDGPDYREFEAAPHLYWERPLNDPFTKLEAEIEAGRVTLDRSGEKAFLLSLLKALNIPASSQTLLFSTTSLQLSLIKPYNPRALYFNEDVYVGYIPGGKIEIVSLDPELGGIFFIMDIPRDERPLQIERSTRCMNCHARADTDYVPGIVFKSVIPGPNGGSLKSFRQEQTGHGIPFEERFGGWYLTGDHNLTRHQANLSGRLAAGVLTTTAMNPAELMKPERYPLPSSDILPHLVQEHQAGFVNRALKAAYLTRTYLHSDGGSLTADHARELDEQARVMVRYLLFADEVTLPAKGIGGDAGFKHDYLNARRVDGTGASLKDFDLKTRMFKHRCSYMIYSAVFQALPAPMKDRIYGQLRSALDASRPDAEFAYLPANEKAAIRSILKGTLEDLPPNW